MNNFSTIVADLLGSETVIDYTIEQLRERGINTDQFGAEIEMMNRDPSGEYTFEKRKQDPNDQEMFTIRIRKRNI